MSSPVFGFAEWTPTPRSQEIVDAVLAVLDENAAYLPMTGRQIFYRLVGAYGYGKTEKKYKALLEKISRGRRAGLIPWQAIRDDGVTQRGGGGFDSPTDWLRSFRAYAEGYRRDRQDRQSQRIEVWVEAAGMVPQVSRVASRFGIPVYSSGGFNSVTMKFDAAMRMTREWRNNRRPTLVLHVGDHDPSGVSIFDNLKVDVPSFVYGLVEEDERISKWERIAVTPEQADRFSLEEAPPKRTDSRSTTWLGGTVQVEAMTPAQLADEIEAAILRHVDENAFETVCDEEAVERAELLGRLDRLF